MKLFRRPKPSHRPAFTMLEVTACIAVLGTVLAILAQTSIWSMRERARNGARQTAVELVANLLEAARAEPWESLTAKWAANQKLPADHERSLPKGRLEVRVEEDVNLGSVKKIAVEVHWEAERNLPESVQLVTLLASRASAGKKGSP